MLIESDINIDLKFKKKKTYCINLKVINCFSSSPMQCANYRIKDDCFYKDMGENNGIYKPNIYNGSYEYIGIGKGRYNYECTGRETDMIKGSSDDETQSQYVHLCGLLPGEYQINATPKTQYTIEPNDSCIQDVHLGTSNLEFEITLNQK